MKINENDFNKITDLMEKVSQLKKEKERLQYKINNALEVIEKAGMDDYQIICLVEKLLQKD